MKNAGLLLIVAVILLIGLLGWAVLSLLAPAQLTGNEPRELESEIAALREAISSLAASHGGAGGGERAHGGASGGTGGAASREGHGRATGGGALREVLDETDAERLADALDRLTTAVERQSRLLEGLAQGGGSGPASFEPAGRAKKGADWEAFKPIIEQYHQSREMTRQSLQLLTTKEVMQRFGPPTRVYGDSGGMRWSYLKDYDPRTLDRSGEISLSFNAGYLIDISISGM